MTEAVKEGKFPKNIRQIGQVSGSQKVYLEDYVITYLKQPPAPEESMRIVVLYGRKEMLGDELCWFVSGAVGAEKDFFMEKTVIDQESWQHVNEMAGKFFPELAVLGWAIVGSDSTSEIEDQILRTQKQFFRSDQKLYFEYNTDEKEETVFLYEKGKMRRQTGYYVYYERNECMQNYMVSLRAAERHPEEFEANRTIQQFRETVSEKKQEIHRRRSATLMTCISLILVMVIMIIGVTMLNNYEKMQNMEQVLYQISGKIDQTSEADLTAQIDTMEKEETLVQESVSVMDQVEENKVDEPAPSISKEELQENAEMTQEDESVPEEKAEEEVGKTAEEIQEETEQIQEEAPAAAVQTTYVIQKGDTLAKICMKYYGNLSNIDLICELNSIENKDNILYGQKILLP